MSGELVLISEKDIEYVINFFSLAPLNIAVSIVPMQIAEMHLLEPDFHGFHSLLFKFASQ